MAHNKDILLEKINDRSAVVGIVGLGYVGLPLGLRFSACGFRVVGLDINAKLNATLNEGKSPFHHITSDLVADAVAAGFHAYDDFAKVAECDAVIFCVPTPLTEHQEPDISYILNSLDAVLKHLTPNTLLSLESTTFPGTTDEVMREKVEEAGFKVGEDVFLAYSPEREDPGRTSHGTADTPKVCGAVTPACSDVAMALYSAVINKVVKVSSARIAEMTKLLENIYRSVNIGLVNELKIVCDKMDIDIYEVIDAAATKPYGFTPFYPGPGIGGHCIPIDPFYLTWKAKEWNIHTRFIELAGEINNHMPLWVVRRVAEALNDHGKAVNGSKVLVLGLAYKGNIDDTRESPSVELIRLLKERHADVSYHDPFVKSFPPRRKNYFPMDSTELTKEMLQETDCVLLATHHDNVDYKLILEHASLIVDTRGKFPADAPNVVRA